MTKQFFLKTATLLTALLGAVGSQANMQSHVSLSCLNPFRTGRGLSTSSCNKLQICT